MRAARWIQHQPCIRLCCCKLWCRTKACKRLLGGAVLMPGMMLAQTATNRTLRQLHASKLLPAQLSESMLVFILIQPSDRASFLSPAA